MANLHKIKRRLSWQETKLAWLFDWLWGMGRALAHQHMKREPRGHHTAQQSLHSSQATEQLQNTRPTTTQLPVLGLVLEMLFAYQVLDVPTLRDKIMISGTVIMLVLRL